MTNQNIFSIIVKAVGIYFIVQSAESIYFGILAFGFSPENMAADIINLGVIVFLFGYSYYSSNFVESYC